MKTKDYTFEIISQQSPDYIFKHLLDIGFQWKGQFNEHIAGATAEIEDEFEFKAGDGMHYSWQRLIEKIPNKKLIWQVTKSNLSFLKEPQEWTGSKLCFEIESAANSKTLIRFSHIGLQPQIECYDACSSAWNLYMEALKKKLA